MPSLSRVVPVEENFRARPEELLEVLKGKLERYAGRIGADESFCVRFERRGLKGRISSGEVEREIGRHLWDLLAREEKSPKVELEDPDKIIAIQSAGTLFGMGIIDRWTRERYPFVR
jgi:tRNA(Ser,Leu) C12 N-acetylase TAN1